MNKRIYIVLFFIFLIKINGYSESFTIAVLPDTQCYTQLDRQRSGINDKWNYPIDSADIFYKQTEYIVKNSKIKGGTIVYAIHLGDVVNSRCEVLSEWEIADKAMSTLDKVVPFTIVPGNHDYDRWIRNENKKLRYIEGGETFCKYFGADSKYFKNNSNYKAFFNNGMDSFSTFKAEDYEIGILGLECEPDDSVINWAQNILDKYKKLPIILVTHSFLSLNYSEKTPGQIDYLKPELRIELGGNSPSELYKKLIYPNKQIFMVLCGHVISGREGEAVRTDIDKDGYKVYELLSDFQGRQDLLSQTAFKGKPCGDGWFRLMDFDIPNRKIKVKTYSTEFQKYEKDANSDFTIEFDWNWDERFGIKNE